MTHYVSDDETLEAPLMELFDEHLQRKRSVSRKRKDDFRHKKKDLVNYSVFDSDAYKRGAGEKNVPIRCGHGNSFTWQKKEAAKAFRRESSRELLSFSSEEQGLPVYSGKGAYRRFYCIDIW